MSLTDKGVLKFITSTGTAGEVEFRSQETTLVGGMPDQITTTANTVYRFGDFELRAASGELFRHGTRVRLQEQSLQVLLALLENPGAVVSREQLRERPWPGGTYVDFEHGLNAAVKRLRAALGDDADDPRYVETLPKRGYRFAGQVWSEGTPAAPDEAPQAVPSTKPPGKTKLAPAVLVALILIAGMGLLLWGWRSGRFFRANASATNPAPPQNAEAYELYLRSLGYKYEYPLNGQAIGLLERSTSLDPRSARSWYELAKRYNVEFTNAARGRGYFEQAREANRRALELAPDFTPARLNQAILDVEGGQVVAAYHAALTMTRQYPQDANAHLALSSALRYGGMFEEAAGECERALKLDPSRGMYPGCAMVNVFLGRYDRASAILDLDALSILTHFRRMELAVLRNDRMAALQQARSIYVNGPHDYPDARLMEAALSGAPAEIVRDRSQEDEALNDRITLPELHFVDARYQSWAGQTAAALRLLRRAIANNYCSYPVMDSDPFLANIRRLPEYQELRQAGMACRENFQKQMQTR